MPEPPLNPRQESLDSGGASSFEGSSVCPICLRPHTRTQAGWVAADPGDRGKAVADDGVKDEELANVASSSSTGAETRGNNLVSGCCKPHEPDNTIQQREPRLFEDTPDQANIFSGLGPYRSQLLMQHPEEPQHDVVVDPVEIPQQQVQEPAADEMMLIMNFQVASFAIGLGGRIAPFSEEQFCVGDGGLENLNFFMNQ